MNETSTFFCADHDNFTRNAYIRKCQLTGRLICADPLINRGAALPSLDEISRNEELLRAECAVLGCSDTVPRENGSSCQHCLADITNSHASRCTVTFCYKPSATDSLCMWHEYCAYNGFGLRCFRCASETDGNFFCVPCRAMCRFKLAVGDRVFCNQARRAGQKVCDAHMPMFSWREEQ